MFFRWALILILCSGMIVHAQPNSNIPFETIGLEQGLPQSSANIIFKDHLGYLWFGTGVGISRYNGLVFDNFVQDPNDSFSISKGNRTAITEDDVGNIWTGTQLGTVSIYESSKNIWKNIDPGFVNQFKSDYPSLYSSQTGWIWKFIYDSKRKKIYAATVQTGLYEIDQLSGKVTRYWDPKGFTKTDDNGVNTILGITEINQDELMLMTGNGLCIFNRETKKFTKSFFRTIDPNKQVTFFQAVEYSSNKYYISSTNGLYDFDLSTGSYDIITSKPKDPNSLSSNYLVALHLTRDKKHLWINTQGIGADILDLETKKIKRINSETDPKNPLLGETIYSIIEDNDGIIWIGTSGLGIVKYDPYKNRIKSVLDNSPQKMALGFLAVFGTFYDKQERIWVGSTERGGGVTMLDIEKGVSKRYFTDPNITYISWSFGQDRKGNIYALASSDRGDLLYRKMNNKVSFEFIDNLTDLKNNGKLPNYFRTYFMYLSNNGSLIIGGIKAIEVADSSGNIKLKEFKSLDKLEDPVSNISKQSDGFAYIIGSKAIWRWDEKNDQLINVTP